jgi:RNA polymerase sigma-70 factor, ECF subfamily
MNRPLTDEQLLSGGDAASFAALYERRYPLVRAYLRRRLGGHPDLVLDLTAETFARALAHREQFESQRGTAINWLIGIARRLLLDAVEKGRVDDTSRRRLGMERVSFEQQELEHLERDSGSELEQALASLPREQRDAIEKRVLEDESYATIAASIGCSEQVVRKRVSRGLATLRRRVTEIAKRPIPSSRESVGGGSRATRRAGARSLAELVLQSAARTRDGRHRDRLPRAR